MGGDAGTVKDIAEAGLVIIVGANPTEGHPVLATRVKRAHKLHDQKLIVADLRKHEMASVRIYSFIRAKELITYGSLVLRNILLIKIGTIKVHS